VWLARKNDPRFALGQTLCFVSLLAMSVSSTVPGRRPIVRRAHWLRLIALLVALLGLSAQQRTLTPALRPNASVVRVVAQRVQSIESQAVRAQPAVRVPAAPEFGRIPSFSEPRVAGPRPSAERCKAPPDSSALCVSTSHFHSKRRIPRMNSDEPPRA